MRKYSRRQFMVLGTGMGMGLIGALLSIPAIGFVLSPLFAKRRLAWVSIGSIENIPVNTPTVASGIDAERSGVPDATDQPCCLCRAQGRRQRADAQQHLHAHAVRRALGRAA